MDFLKFNQLKIIIVASKFCCGSIPFNFYSSLVGHTPQGLPCKLFINRTTSLRKTGVVLSEGDCLVSKMGLKETSGGFLYVLFVISSFSISQLNRLTNVNCFLSSDFNISGRIFTFAPLLIC